MPAGLLRGMRLHRRAELWQELGQNGWVELPGLRTAFMQVRCSMPQSWIRVQAVQCADTPRTGRGRTAARADDRCAG